jgi:hypothetical protein
VRRNKLVGRGTPFILGVLGIALLVVVAVFVGGCGGEQTSDTSTAEQGGTTQQKTEPAKKSVASVGEPITVGEAQWAVTDVRQLPRLVSTFGIDDGNFVVVDVTFANNSNQDVTLATPYLSLVDSEGREFEVDLDITYAHVDPDKNMFIDTVKPGDTKEGSVIFSVDPDASGFELQAGDATNFVSNEHGYIDLGV